MCVWGGRRGLPTSDGNDELQPTGVNGGLSVEVECRGYSRGKWWAEMAAENVTFYLPPASPLDGCCWKGWRAVGTGRVK